MDTSAATETLALPYGAIAGQSGHKYKTGDKCRIIGGRKDGKVEVRMLEEPNDTLILPTHWVLQKGEH